MIGKRINQGIRSEIQVAAVGFVGVFGSEIKAIHKRGGFVAARQFIQQHILMFTVFCFGMYRKIGDFGVAEYNAFDGVRHQGVFHVFVGVAG